MVDFLSLFTCSEDYVDLLFSIADKFQKLILNENERNLLKCVAFFTSGEFFLLNLYKKSFASSQR